LIVGAAVLPHPPLLLRELTGAADPVAGLRRSCAEAVADVLACRPDEVLIVGSTDAGSTAVGSTAVGSTGVGGTDADGTRTAGTGAGTGTGTGTGPAPPDAVLDVRAYGSSSPRPPVGAPLLPLSLGIGARLLDDAAWQGSRTLWAVARDAPTEHCLDLGRELASRPARTVLLVMGDGTARRSTTAPGYLDDRAAPFDAAATEALAGGDAAVLATLDPHLAADLLAAGRAPWQVLAGAVPNAEARLLTAEDPYGVLYVVATWLPQ